MNIDDFKLDEPPASLVGVLTKDNLGQDIEGYRIEMFGDGVQTVGYVAILDAKRIALSQHIFSDGTPVDLKSHAAPNLSDWVVYDLLAYQDFEIKGTFLTDEPSVTHVGSITEESLGQGVEGQRIELFGKGVQVVGYVAKVRDTEILLTQQVYSDGTPVDSLSSVVPGLTDIKHYDLTKFIKCELVRSHPVPEY